MRRPALKDLGQTVELDLHGASIPEAITLLRRTLMVSECYGRMSVKVIHGYSTSVNPRKHTSIRDELYKMLDEGDLTAVVNHYKGTGYTILSLGYGSPRNPNRITMREITGAG